MKSIINHVSTILAGITLALSLTACSGGGSGSSPSTTQVSGSVFAGPAAGSSVTVKDASGMVVAGPVTTAADGSYTIAVPTSRLSADLVFEASGGTYTDEATAAAGVPLGSLSAHAPAGSLAAGSVVTIDPSSTIVQKLVAGGKSRGAAEADYRNAFGYTPDCSITPSFANTSTASSTAERLAGLRNAAFSQLTKDLGIPAANQHELINALGEDLADGGLDGKKFAAALSVNNVALPEDIGNRFGQALITFQRNPLLNRSKLTPDRIGQPVLYTTALTDSYKVEFLPDATKVQAQGRSSFRIRLTGRASGQPVSGAGLTIKPFMYMATKSHTTPIAPVIDNGDGTYDCTVYYVMPTDMGSISMGVWEIKVTIGSESACFYPYVAMSMGMTSLTKLLGINDAISGMTGTEKRTWFLFSDSFTAAMGGNYTFRLFLATKENLNSFPAVFVGSSLKNENGAFWNVSSIAMEASTNGTDWVSGVDNGSGYWTFAGLTGLTSGVEGTIRVRLTVNGEQKSSDGALPSGINGYQSFRVTPGGM